MEKPDTPRVEASEPKKEEEMVNKIMEMMKDSERRRMFTLKSVHDLLEPKGLEVDENGFIIYSDTGEFSVPYQFSRDKLQTNNLENYESIFDAFFVPMNEEGFPQREKLHLTDLHSVITLENGESHPVEDDVFDIAEFHHRLESVFMDVTEWSDALTGDEKEHGKWIHFGGSFNDDEYNINCFSPDCNFTAPVEEWDGSVKEPVCPECEGPWDESITICTSCGEWSHGITMSGEDKYASPICPHCGEGNRNLTVQSRYDEF